MLLQTRVVFHGPEIGLDVDFTLGEMGVETSILLLCALALTALVPRAVPAVVTTKVLVGVALVCAAVGLGVLVNPVVSGELDRRERLLERLAPRLRRAGGALRGARARNAQDLPAGSRAPRASARFFSLSSMRRWKPDALSRAPESEWTCRRATRNITPIQRSGCCWAWRCSPMAYGEGPSRRVWPRLSSSSQRRSRCSLFDLAGLEGALRALSFLGLGRRADRDRPRLSARRLRQTAARNALRGLARAARGAVTG